MSHTVQNQLHLNPLLAGVFMFSIFVSLLMSMGCQPEPEYGICEDVCKEVYTTCNFAAYPSFDSCLEGCFITKKKEPMWKHNMNVSKKLNVTPLPLLNVKMNMEPNPMTKSITTFFGVLMMTSCTVDYELTGARPDVTVTSQSVLLQKSKEPIFWPMTATLSLPVLTKIGVEMWVLLDSMQQTWWDTHSIRCGIPPQTPISLEIWDGICHFFRWNQLEHEPQQSTLRSRHSGLGSRFRCWTSHRVGSHWEGIRHGLSRFHTGFRRIWLDHWRNR